MWVVLSVPTFAFASRNRNIPFLSAFLLANPTQGGEPIHANPTTFNRHTEGGTQGSTIIDTLLYPLFPIPSLLLHSSNVISSNLFSHCDPRGCHCRKSPIHRCNCTCRTGSATHSWKTIPRTNHAQSIYSTYDRRFGYALECYCGARRRFLHLWKGW